MKTLSISSRLLRAVRAVIISTFSLLFFLSFSSMQVHAQGQESKRFEVQVQTSDIKKAGTAALVYITLYGTRNPDGEKSRTDLDISGELDFRRDQISTYQVTTVADMGEITHVKMEHDNSGNGAGWHLDTVAVRPLGSSESWTLFTFKRWLATNEGDRLTETTKKRRDDYDAWFKELPNKNATPVGTWGIACSGGQNCTTQVQTSMSFGGSEKHVFSKEVSESLSITVTSTAGNKLEGVENSVAVTGSVAGKHTNVSEMLTTKSDDHSESCGININMVDFNIGFVWQWQISTAYQGTSVVVSTCQIACTPDGRMPSYTPADPRNLASCEVPKTYASIPNAGIEGHNEETLEKVSLKTCMDACTNSKAGFCKSIDYERGPGKCYLQDVSQDDEGVSLKRDYPDNPYDHYFPKVR